VSSLVSFLQTFCAPRKWDSSILLALHFLSYIQLFIPLVYLLNLYSSFKNCINNILNVKPLSNRNLLFLTQLFFPSSVLMEHITHSFEMQKILARMANNLWCIKMLSHPIPILTQNRSRILISDHKL
jgi:hypothetical protein